MKIPRNKDGRYSLTEKQEAEFRQDVAENLLTRKEIQIKYNISVSKVQQAFQPKKHLSHQSKRSSLQGRYYNVKKNSEAQKKHREKIKNIENIKEIVNIIPEERKYMKIKKENKQPKEMAMVSIPRTLHTRIKMLAAKDKRTIRAYLDILITREESKDND